MAFQVGRITGLNEPRDWQSSGGRVTVIGSYKASSLLDGLIRRDQLLGYAAGADGDEASIPLIIDGEPRVNGFYRPLGVDFTTDEHVRRQGNLFDYRIDLEPVFGYGQPMFESIITGALASNVIGAVAGDMIFFHAAPVGVSEYYKSGAPPYYTRTGSEAGIQFYTGGTVSDIAHFYASPANYYLGAARIELTNGPYPLVGRTMPLAVTDWALLRISNSLVRVMLGTTGDLLVSHWVVGSATWSAYKTFQIQGTTLAGAMNLNRSVMVLRNSPEEVSVRIGLQPSNGINIVGRLFLDVALRRGDRTARCYLTSDIADTWQVRLLTTEAATAVTYGAVTLGNIRATANDAAGLRYVLMSIQSAVTNDLVNGRLTQNVASKTFDFGISAENPGGTAVAPDRAVDIAQQYLAVQSEKQQVVAR
jgi:hypothetical protein